MSAARSWFQLLAAQKQIKRELASGAVDALTKALQGAGRTQPGDAAVNEMMARIVEQFKKG